MEEKQEHKCEYCDETQYDYKIGNTYRKSLYKYADEDGDYALYVHLNICKDKQGFYLEATGEDDCESKYLNYCPFCGRKL